MLVMVQKSARGSKFICCINAGLFVKIKRYPLYINTQQQQQQQQNTRKTELIQLF